MYIIKIYIYNYFMVNMLIKKIKLILINRSPLKLHQQKNKKIKGNRYCIIIEKKNCSF